MKKLITMLLLFTFSLFIANSQSQITYVDSLKKVTVNVTSVDKKQQAKTDNLQLQFAKSVDNQTLAVEKFSGVLDSFAANVWIYAKEIAQRNKEGSQTKLDKLGYSPDRVKRIIRVERWLNFSLVSGIIVYVFFISFAGPWQDRLKWSPGAIAVKVLCTLSIAFAAYILLAKFLTLLFNGDYYVIKELINLYS